ncbi:MAG TPA: CotH kinase family protein [Candidatus Avichristensenella intestinipullorum]|uniref:CotH kinase family protein n=1 Tax=Candidatus Avichristensenella intestinipullorum TaxID=2840693 RepID=A0A9D1CIF4_9FIRM|nr:CotH kinase family protein [Candidatus Avichristensenella intestinipullorum]
MFRQKHVDFLCIGATVLAAAIALLFVWGQGEAGTAGPTYDARLFDAGRVHTVDIRVEDWHAFVRDAPGEEYIPCDVTIDGETFHNVGLRAKGNNSRRLTEEYGLSRYSMKLEFDRYQDGGQYYGLDKFSLDASFQDNSYLKTYLAYDMMAFMEVPAPLCSYVWVTVNGRDWGLFLAVEEPEEAFARRNFGNAYGKLYKPDYRSLEAENADVALRYIDDNPQSYPGIFENAKFYTTEADRRRLIGALKTLASGENLETAVAVDEVLRYFTVQVFVMNWDSYLGHTGHNYFLYEQDGILRILPWDYNLAFGTYALGMSNPVQDPNVLINYPINTPAPGEIMRNRPLYHHLMQHDEVFARYHAYFDRFLTEYVESGRLEAALRGAADMIAPYVRRDPTAFCSFDDHRLAVDVLEEVCRLRAQSIRGQLDGSIPATLRERQENPGAGVEASHVNLSDLGDFEDLEASKERQDDALEKISGVRGR